MSLFKVTYASNKPISCRLVLGKLITGKYTYEFVANTLIYAFINACDENEAFKIAEEVTARFMELQGQLI